MISAHRFEATVDDDLREAADVARRLRLVADVPSLDETQLRAFRRARVEIRAEHLRSFDTGLTGLRLLVASVALGVSAMALHNVAPEVLPLVWTVVALAAGLLLAVLVLTLLHGRNRRRGQTLRMAVALAEIVEPLGTHRPPRPDPPPTTGP